MTKYSIEKHQIAQDRQRNEYKTEFFVSKSKQNESGGWDEIDVERVFPTHQEAVNYLVNKQVSSTDIRRYG